jgi:hypothetical protein
MDEQSTVNLDGDEVPRLVFIAQREANGHALTQVVLTD